MTAVQEFNEFTLDNDPYGEHDMGIIEVNGDKFIWKIDYYDLKNKYLSPNPADPKKTHRVLTITNNIEERYEENTDLTRLSP